MTRTPVDPGLPALPDDVVARFRAAAPTLTADGAGIAALGRRRRRTRRLVAGALAAVVVAGAAGAAAGMLRGPAAPPADGDGAPWPVDGDLAPSPAEVVGSRGGMPAGVPVEFAGPVGVLIAPDGRLHVWTTGSSSCPVIPLTTAVADGVVVVEVGTDPAGPDDCTADDAPLTTIVALPWAMPLDPPPAVEVRDVRTGTVLASSSDVPGGLEPVTVLEVRDGWPAWLAYPESGLGTGEGTEPGTIEVWTAGTTDCPAVPVAQLVATDGFLTWVTQAPEDSGCTGDTVLTTWVLPAPEGWDPTAQVSGTGPLNAWVPGAPWPGGTGSPLGCDGMTPTLCAMDRWLVTSIEAAGYAPAGGKDDSGDVATDSVVSGSGPVFASVEHNSGGVGSEVPDPVRSEALTITHGDGDGSPVYAWFDCGPYRFTFVSGIDVTPAGAEDTVVVAEAVAAAVGSCPADDRALIARFAEAMAAPQP